MFMLNENRLASVSVFIIAGLSDVADGYLARRLDSVSELGKLLDPLVDKFMQIVVLITICYCGLINGIEGIVLTFILIELAMFIGSMVLLNKKIVVEANWYGKVSNLFFYIAVIIAILEPQFGKAFLYMALIMQFMASILYYKNYIKSEGV